MSNKILLKSILYVEDEKGVQEELSEILEDFCETLYLADDGIQGLQQYKKIKPDIVITDIKMPFMDGIEMAKKIKEINEDAHMIFTTAFSDIEFFQEAIDLQVDGYILKPINLLLLEKKIKNIAKQISIKNELQKKEQMLIQQSKLASMGEMISAIAHQWRQPLNALNGTLTNIIDAKKYNELSLEYLEKQIQNAENQIQYMSKTIDDFRNYFKPSLKKEKIFIDDVIKNAISLIHKSLKEKKIDINFKYKDLPVQYYGYKNLLQQVILNILHNSIDAFSQNIYKYNAIISIDLTINKYNIIILIQDNAGGIEEKNLDKIFEPYFTTKLNQNGTGIGLYMSKMIIEHSFNGTLNIENNNNGVLTTINLEKE